MGVKRRGEASDGLQSRLLIFIFLRGLTRPRAILVKIAPRRSCAGRNLAPPVVMLSGAGGGAETSLGERRRTQDARQRESAPPHFHSLTRPDKALGHSCEDDVRHSRTGGNPGCAGSARGVGMGWDASCFHSLTRSDKALGNCCEGRNPASLGADGAGLIISSGAQRSRQISRTASRRGTRRVPLCGSPLPLGEGPGGEGWWAGSPTQRIAERTRASSGDTPSAMARP